MVGEGDRRQRGNGREGDWTVMERVEEKTPWTGSRRRERVCTSRMWERTVGVSGSVNFRHAAEVTRSHGCSYTCSCVYVRTIFVPTATETTGEELKVS